MEETQPTHNKYTTTPRFLLAMECLLFILRPVQILLWCKLWELDFGDVDETGMYADFGVVAGGAGPGVIGVRHSMPAMSSGGGTHHVMTGGVGGGGGGGGGGAEPGGGQPPRDGYRPFIVPEAGAQAQRSAHSGDAYVPPVSPPMSPGKTSLNTNEYGE